MITVYTDGACRVSNPGLCSAAFVVYDNDKIIFEWSMALPGLNTNNYAEYQGVLYALAWLSNQNFQRAEIFCDSRLVVEQVNGRWACNKPDLLPFKKQAMYHLVRGSHKLTHIDGHAGHAGNERADLLCNRELDLVQLKGEHAKQSTN